MLPFVIHDIVKNGSDIHADVISRHITMFFANHCAHSARRPSLSGHYVSYHCVICHWAGKL